MLDAERQMPGRRAAQVQVRVAPGVELRGAAQGNAPAAAFARMMNLALKQTRFAADLKISTRSRWAERVWHLDGIRPATAPGEFSLNWAFEIGERRFTDAKWCSWCAAAKTFLWSLKADPPPGSSRIDAGVDVQDRACADPLDGLAWLSIVYRAGPRGE